VRTNVEPTSAVQSIAREVHQLDANQPLARVRTMDAVMDESLAPRRAPMGLFALFAGVALFLSAIGIYGLLSYYVVQRRQEIGVRMALGAQRSHVLGLVLKEGTKLIAIGIGVGLMFAFIASRAMISLLYGINRQTFHVPGRLVCIGIAGAGGLLRACVTRHPRGSTGGVEERINASDVIAATSI